MRKASQTFLIFSIILIPALSVITYVWKPQSGDPPAYSERGSVQSCVIVPHRGGHRDMGGVPLQSKALISGSPFYYTRKPGKLHDNLVVSFCQIIRSI